VAREVVRVLTALTHCSLGMRTITETPEDSDYTSIQRRIRTLQGASESSADGENAEQDITPGHRRGSAADLGADRHQPTGSVKLSMSSRPASEVAGGGPTASAPAGGVS